MVNGSIGTHTYVTMLIMGTSQIDYQVLFELCIYDNAYSLISCIMRRLFYLMLYNATTRRQEAKREPLKEREISCVPSLYTLIPLPWKNPMYIYEATSP
jgi:hypothetical protein